MSPEEMKVAIFNAIAQAKERHMAKKRIVDLEALKDINKKAYDRYVEYLIANCQDEFTVFPNGKITAYSEYNGWTGEWSEEENEWPEE